MLAEHDLAQRPLDWELMLITWLARGHLAGALQDLAVLSRRERWGLLLRIHAQQER